VVRPAAGPAISIVPACLNGSSPAPGDRPLRSRQERQHDLFNYLSRHSLSLAV
jgi:hypothetical protein